ncbi:MAG: F0F1 ATP synthase subunit B' [Rhodospirillaceae bacterium]|nr:F0F1 ATP synthase subunit B' [Rhodospirillaceae bacterium]|tara:strand:- start:508 stop:1128 length:621 start_codon:yes stop_codon:yes gene_type:complete
MKLKYSFSATILTLVLGAAFPRGAAEANSETGPKLPQLDIGTYASQIFWLIVSFIVLYFLISKFAIPRIAEVLEERQERIADDLDKAETLKKEAYQVRIEYEKALTTARERAQEATRLAQEEIAKRGAEVEAAAQEKVTVMLDEAEKRISAVRTGAVTESEDTVEKVEQSVAREVVANAVEKLIGVQVSTSDVEMAISSTLEERLG